MVHEGQKDHQCEFCEKLFPTAGSFKSHIDIRLIHDGRKDKNCEICNKLFVIKGLLIDATHQKCTC